MISQADATPRAPSCFFGPADPSAVHRGLRPGGAQGCRRADGAGWRRTRRSTRQAHLHLLQAVGRRWSQTTSVRAAWCAISCNRSCRDENRIAGTPAWRGGVARRRGPSRGILSSTASNLLLARPLPPPTRSTWRPSLRWSNEPRGSHQADGRAGSGLVGRACCTA